jgi:hypothetical protein
MSIKTDAQLLLDTLKTSSTGMTTEALESILGWSKDLLTTTLNELSAEQRVEFLTLNNSLVFRAR